MPDTSRALHSRRTASLFGLLPGGSAGRPAGAPRPLLLRRSTPVTILDCRCTGPGRCSRRCGPPTRRAGLPLPPGTITSRPIRACCHSLCRLRIKQVAVVAGPHSLLPARLNALGATAVKRRHSWKARKIVILDGAEMPAHVSPALRQKIVRWVSGGATLPRLGRRSRCTREP